MRTKLRRLTSNMPRLAERLEVHAIHAIGQRLYEAQLCPAKIASRGHIQKLLQETSGRVAEIKFSARFLLGEWEDVVDAWQLQSREAYRDVKRLGRKTRLPEQRRAVLWSVFEEVKANLRQQGQITRAEMFGRLAEKIRERRHTSI
ncbi:MAG: hypothetical protein U5R30_08350 [Deltaproteobacteria bacterium]|nr:hypothetical protein [Deltaproteobacteria bacterium]